MLRREKLTHFFLCDSRKNSHDIDTTWCPPPKRWGDFNFRKLKASKEEFFYHRMGSKAIWGAVIKISKGGII